jgi:hypothetical protein
MSCTCVVELHEIHVIDSVSYAIYSVLINPTNITGIVWLDATCMYFRISEGNVTSRIKQNMSLHVGSTYLISWYRYSKIHYE